MENGNCIINVDTQLQQHNKTALWGRFQQPTSPILKLFWLQIQFGGHALTQFSRTAYALADLSVEMYRHWNRE